ncbi:MAG: hypothetical protein CMI26_06940 [Opitutae bacterium]|nr:hypothetical protein [Opitutae bacterium]
MVVVVVVVMADTQQQQKWEANEGDQSAAWTVSSKGARKGQGAAFGSVWLTEEESGARLRDAPTACRAEGSALSTVEASDARPQGVTTLPRSRASTACPVKEEGRGA